MNANKILFQVAVSISLTSFAGLAFAVDGLGASGNRKVQGAMAKNWANKPGDSQQYGNTVNQRQVVNIGNKKTGCSNVNIGTAQPGQKAPKEIVVTTKEVINVCK